MHWLSRDPHEVFKDRPLKWCCGILLWTTPPWEAQNLNVLLLQTQSHRRAERTFRDLYNWEAFRQDESTTTCLSSHINARVEVRHMAFGHPGHLPWWSTVVPGWGCPAAAGDTNTDQRDDPKKEQDTCSTRKRGGQSQREINDTSSPVDPECLTWAETKTHWRVRNDGGHLSRADCCVHRAAAGPRVDTHVTWWTVVHDLQTSNRIPAKNCAQWPQSSLSTCADVPHTPATRWP
jgi:hypothetical protein